MFCVTMCNQYETEIDKLRLTDEYLQNKRATIIRNTNVHTEDNMMCNSKKKKFIIPRKYFA